MDIERQGLLLDPARKWVQRRRLAQELNSWNSAGRRGASPQLPLLWAHQNRGVPQQHDAARHQRRSSVSACFDSLIHRAAESRAKRINICLGIIL
jgi:hypothetical protein